MLTGTWLDPLFGGTARGFPSKVKRTIVAGGAADAALAVTGLSKHSKVWRASIVAGLASRSQRVDFEKHVADAGTWSNAVSAGGLWTRVRTAAAAAESLWGRLPVRQPQVSGRRVIPVKLEVNYEVSTAVQTDVRFEVWKNTLAAQAADPTAAVLFGQSDAHYDVAHNTVGERVAVAKHRATVTAPAAVALAEGEALQLRSFVDGSATGVLTVREAAFYWSEMDIYADAAQIAESSITLAAGSFSTTVDTSDKLVELVWVDI